MIVLQKNSLPVEFFLFLACIRYTNLVTIITDLGTKIRTEHWFLKLCSYFNPDKTHFYFYS